MYSAFSENYGACMRRTLTHLSTFYRSLWKAFKQPQTLAFVALGNIILLPLSFLFYYFEHENNISVGHYGDAVWWAYATVTTVGYGDIVPVTELGRVVGVLLMLGGATCFVGFTAVFVPVFIAEYTRDVLLQEEDTLEDMGHRLKAIENSLSQLVEIQKGNYTNKESLSIDS